MLEHAGLSAGALIANELAVCHPKLDDIGAVAAAISLAKA